MFASRGESRGRGKKENELGSRVSSLGLEAQVALPRDNHSHCNLGRIPGALFYEEQEILS